MTHGDIRTRVLQRLEADPTDSSWQASATAAINEGLRLFAFLTLTLEASSDFTLTPGTSIYHMLPVRSDWLVPLRVELNGSKLRPATVYQMASLDSAWLITTGTATRYGSLGWDLLFLNRIPVSADTLSITYARSATALVGDNDVPEIHDADHEILIDYGVARLRLNEGGQELNEAVKLLQGFLEAAKKRATQVLARSLAQGYDYLPVELVPELRQLT